MEAAVNIESPINAAVTPADIKADVLRHLTFTLGKDAANASTYDWRMALSFAIR